MRKHSSGDPATPENTEFVTVPILARQLGIKYGYTLTVLSSEELPIHPDYEETDDKDLIESWTPKFAYGR